MVWTGNDDGAATAAHRSLRFRADPARRRRALHEAWLNGYFDRGEGEASALINALLAGDGPTIERLFGRLLVTRVSYFDLGGPREERFYHAFTLGLLAYIGRQWRVHSNVEAGEGRADVVIVPRSPGAPGAVIELKVAAGRTRSLERAAASPGARGGGSKLDPGDRDRVRPEAGQGAGGLTAPTAALAIGGPPATLVV